MARSHVARARGAVQFSRQARHTQDTPNDRQTHHQRPLFTTEQAAAVSFFQHACIPDFNPHYTWAWNAIKREMWAVRNRITLKAEAARAWAAVRSWQLPERLLRDCHRFSRVEWEQISTDSQELSGERSKPTTYPPTQHVTHQNKHTITTSTHQTILIFRKGIMIIFTRSKLSKISPLSTSPQVYLGFGRVLPSTIGQKLSKIWVPNF